MITAVRGEARVQLAGQLLATHVGQPQVDERDVGQRLPDAPERLTSGRRFRHDFDPGDSRKG